MFVASAKKRTLDEARPTCPRGSSRSQVKKKTQSAPELLPPLCQQPPSLAAVLVSRPLFSHTSVLGNIPSRQTLSGKEFSCQAAKVGHGRTLNDKEGTVGAHLMASQLRTHIPDQITDGLPAQSFARQSKSIKVTSGKDTPTTILINQNVGAPNKTPLSGTDVVELFSQKQDLGEWQLYYLREVDDESYRPYDLQVVHCSDAGSEHYIFSPNSVLHVTERGYGGLVSPAEWFRESCLWRALQKIHFFKDFRLQKAFAWWNINVRRIVFNRKCEDLQDALLIAVPQFRDALLLFSRTIEELRTMLPQDECRSCTLLEFKKAQTTVNRERSHILEKLSRCRGVILSKVKADSYNTHQQLLLHIEYAKKPSQNSEPIYLHMAHQQELKKALSQSKSILEKLGRFAALINQMTVQSLVTVFQNDVTSFYVWKRKTRWQRSLFNAEMCFGADNQLSVEPMIDLFQEAVSDTLLSAGGTLIQMCEASGFFEEFESSVHPSGVEDSASLSACFERLPVTGESSGNDGRRWFCCRRLLGDLLPCPLIQTKALVAMQGNKVHGCFYPLCRQQLEWQISINDVSKQVEKEQVEFIQEAGLEIQQLCERYSWLTDIHLFICQWSLSSLESLIDQPASLYDEYIRRVRHWTERISTLPSSVSSSNQLFTIHCTRLKENLRQQLKMIEDEIYNQLVEQINLHSEGVISDVEKDMTALRTDPKDLHNFSKYTLLVKKSAKMLAGTQRRVKYIHSLQETLSKYYREMTKEEIALEEKMLDLWDTFIPLLREADEVVCCSLPSASKTADAVFLVLLHELQSVLSEASSGPFLDPRENSEEMISKLSLMHAQVHSLAMELEHLSRDIQNLKEIPVDLTILTEGVQLVEARIELWELLAAVRAWRKECQKLHLCEEVVSQTQSKMANWNEKALSLTCVIPAHDAVMQECLRILEHCNRHLGVMAKLQVSKLKQKHLRAICEGIGLLYEPEKRVTIAEMLSNHLEVNDVIIDEVCRDAQAEYKMEQAFESLQQDWEARLLQVERFPLTPPGLSQTERAALEALSDDQTAMQQSCLDAPHFISGVEEHLGRIQSDLMSLSVMLASPHSVDLRPQMEDWLKSLHDLEMLLDLFRRYQQTWIFLTKVFDGNFGAQRMDLLHQFLPVDKTFKEIVHFLSSDPHILTFVRCNKSCDIVHGSSLHQVITNDLSTMESISNQLMEHRDILCGSFPRLWLLSDREVLLLLSSPKSPSALQPLVRKCFKGVQSLEVDGDLPPAKDVDSCETARQGHSAVKVLGIFGSLQEHISFLSPLEADLSTLSWLCALEQRLKMTMAQLMTQCFASVNQLELSSQAADKVADRTPALPVLDLLREYPLQCLLVAEEAAWCNVVLQAFQEDSPVKLYNMKVYTSEKLKSYSHVLRECADSRYTMMCMCVLIQLVMKQGQQFSQLMEANCVSLESSFQWVRLLKYHINSEDRCRKTNNDATCYVDVLNRCLKYDFEYYGPEDWVMVHAPSTDRAMLGILLALTRHRCSFLRGPCMSGKKTTAVHLGRALGRHVHMMRCSPNVTASVVQRMLLGALQAGAWFVLDSVDLLSHRVLLSLGEHLKEMHHFFSGLTEKRRKTRNSEPEDGGANPARFPDSDFHMNLAGKSIHASQHFGCVVIASNWCLSDLPESLRTATRAVALMPPDCRIIAEVMLTSFGFLDAASLSLRLVSLLSLTKDSLCLPNFIAHNQSSYLVLLQKIIRASVAYLRQSFRNEDTKKSSECNRSRLSVTQLILEETAIVKGVLLVCLPLLYEQKKASWFNVMFKETFPISCQFPALWQHIDEKEKKQLTDALSEDLQRRFFCIDPGIIHRVLTLYQTIKSSKAVMLLGPSGSGKTTLYSVLAATLSRLAVTESCGFQNDGVIQGDHLQMSASSWASVDTLVLFPNTMTHKEIFGCFCEKSGWKDGVIAKLLRDLDHPKPTSSAGAKDSNGTPAMKWLVLDGNPVGQPGWLDYLTTLYSSEKPSLCLPSGENLPSHSHLKLLMEVTDLSDASPSAVTRCSLVYLPGTHLWKDVWKSEFNALSLEHKLDQETLEMWNHLAEDLFSRTLSLIRENNLTSAVHNERGSSGNLSYGLQEVMSFARILRALLLPLGKSLISKIERADEHRNDAPSMISHSEQELRTRNSFLCAYIWGFGGHLHFCHWPKFDLLVRQILLTCRIKVVVPDDENMFEHFLNIDTKICPTVMQMNKSITPKHGTYTFLLNCMLEANQPVLLAGEPGSGKTTLCKGFLRFNRPYVSLAASPLLCSRQLLTILQSLGYQKPRKDSTGAKRKLPRLLLFLDDLHEAPCDIDGKTSAALETLRQSISKGQITSFDSYPFRLLSSATMCYLTTCCVFGMGNHHSSVISTRLSRLFSIFVLPSQSMDVILSVHSPWLKHWLKDIPLQQNTDGIASCIITATKRLYHAVSKQFHPTPQRPHFTFSHHDLQKVFSGMCLWQPSIQNTGTLQTEESLVPDCSQVLSRPATTFKIVHVWMHECMRTFGDRLCSDEESRALVTLVIKTASVHFGIAELDVIQSVCEDTRNAINQPPTENHQVSGEILPQGSKPADGSSHVGSGSVEARLQTNPLQSQILQHMQSRLDTLVYGPDLSRPVNEQQRFKCSYQEQKREVLLQQLCELMKKDNSDNYYDVATKCIVHRQRMDCLLHILRALLIPGGHGVLISSCRGTGRKTTVRLAARVTGYHLMEVHPGNENRLHKILKEAVNRTRVMDDVNVIVLVHEGVSHRVREELLVAMAHRSYPGLHTEEELRELVSRVTDVKNSQRYLMDSWMFGKFLNQIHRNIHVFLLLPLNMSETGSHANNATHGLNTQLTKALRFSCCIEMYQPWSRKSLVETAAQFTKHSPCKLQQGLTASLPVAMAGIHQSAAQYASVLLPAHPFSPQTYMEFIASFGYLCKRMREHRHSQASRVSSVLSHLDTMRVTAAQHKEHIIRLQEKVAEAQQQKRELLKSLDYLKRQLEKARETCAVKEKELFHLEEQINPTMQQDHPEFLSGMKILSCLNPSDLDEVRHYRDPPDGVVKILDAICLLFNRPLGWESVRQLLGQSNFFQDLEFFDRTAVTNEQLQQLGHIVNSPLFVPESVREVSKACESLCRWVQAVYECCCMQNHPAAVHASEVLARELHVQLHLAKEHEKDVFRHVEDVKHQLQLVHADLENQLLELRSAQTAETEAAGALRGLETHVTLWRASAQESDLSYQTVPGDALMLAAIISYLGPFGADVRIELLNKWKDLCQTGSIDINPKDVRVSMFVHPEAVPPKPSDFPIPVSEKLWMPLSPALAINPKSPSARAIVKVLLWGCGNAWVQRWPLLADTQQHLDLRSQSYLITGEGVKAKIESETDCGMVLCADDPELLEKLSWAAEKGLRVLLTHVERAVPCPEFLYRLMRSTGCVTPGIAQCSQPTHPEFRLFLSTQLPVHLLGTAIHPSILAQVCVVDLALSAEEIQELMLTQLLPSVYKQQLIQHLQLQNDKQLLQDKLGSEEDALMNYILQSEASPLQDHNFLPRMAVCQEAVNKLQAEIQQLTEELDHQESLMAVPRQLTRLAAALYQALQQVSTLSPSYYFTLSSFITIMQEVFVSDGLIITLNVEKLPDSITSDVTQQMIAQLLVQYRPCLTESHFAVLKLLVSVALLQHKQLCSEAERLSFLKGLQDVEHTVAEVKDMTDPQSTYALPNWIPSHIRPELICLEQIPSFRGLIDALSTCPTEWQEYLHFPSSTVVGAVPCRSHTHLSLLQRALLWKTIVPECLGGMSDTMAVNYHYLPEHKRRSVHPHTGNPKALSRYLFKHTGPIILTLPNSTEEKRLSVHPLHFINQLAQYAANKIKVIEVSFGRLWDTDAILSLLDKAVNDGHWLVFNSCHLLEQWDIKLVAHLNEVMSLFKDRHTEERRLIQQSFRMWFITQECASGSIPASVRLCALPLVCDAPWDLREELSSSVHQAVSAVECRSVSEEDMELLLRCTIFHSVLRQRQAYKCSASGKLYRWGHEDLLALIDAHISFACLCHDKAKALRDIAVNLVYGGHVLDPADLDVVESAAVAFLSRELPLWFGGSHFLVNIISSRGKLDLTGVLHLLDHHPEDSVPSSDPLVLGFSADVADEITKINSSHLSKLLQASQNPLGAVRRFSSQRRQSASLPDYRHTRDRLQALENYLTQKSPSGRTIAGCQGPLLQFLQNEWDDLHDSVTTLLSHLQHPVHCCTLTCGFLLELTNLSHLERRAKVLCSYLWCHSTADPLGSYRLAAFRNARGLLLAVMRQAAYIQGKHISDVTPHLQVVSVGSNVASLLPDAVYLCGLELRGASWDAQLDALQEGACLQMCSMPLVCVEAGVGSINAARATSRCEGQHEKHCSCAQVVDTAPVTEPEFPLYQCPIYLDRDLESTNSGLADVNVIASVALHTKLHPMLCSLRRVRLVSVL